MSRRNRAGPRSTSLRFPGAFPAGSRARAAYCRAGDQAPEPRSLFHLDGVTALDFDYDVARDGQRFLVRLTSEPEGAAGLRVSLAWSDRLGKADAADR
jgi:hypothetical protein